MTCYKKQKVEKNKNQNHEKTQTPKVYKYQKQNETKGSGITKNKYINLYKCKEELCNIQASFGYPHDGIIVSCKKHSSIGMIGLRSVLCKEIGCFVRANFGLTKREFCAKHKKEGHCLITKNNSNEKDLQNQLIKLEAKKLLCTMQKITVRKYPLTGLDLLANVICSM